MHKGGMHKCDDTVGVNVSNVATEHRVCVEVL